VLNELCMKTLFRSCFKTFFICKVNASKVKFVNFSLDCRLQAVSAEKQSERMSTSWAVRLFKTESEPIFSGFPHIVFHHSRPTTGLNCVTARPTFVVERDSFGRFNRPKFRPVSVFSPVDGAGRVTLGHGTTQ